MNKKFFVIVIAIIIIMVAVYLIMYFTSPKNQEKPKNIQEQACIDVGGSWDGTKCVKQQTGIDISDWQTYTNPKYPYTMKYPADWTAKHEYGTNQDAYSMRVPSNSGGKKEVSAEYYELNRFDASSGYALLFAVVPKDSNVVPIPRTGVGAGDFVDANETVSIGGTEVSIKYLVFEGKIKEIFFNDFEMDEFWGRAYLSYFGDEDYRNLDMTGAEEVEIAKTILESFELVSP